MVEKDVFFDALEKSRSCEGILQGFRNVDGTAVTALALDELEKGRAGQLGEIRTWGGKKYHKTAKGWCPVPKGQGGDSGAPKEEKKPGDFRGSDSYEFIFSGEIDPINDKDWEKKSNDKDWTYADMGRVGQTVGYMGLVDKEKNLYGVKYFSPNGKKSSVMHLSEADYKRNLERDRKLAANINKQR